MRLGVFGGTFDPPHIGHLIVAQDAYRALSLDRVLFVPAARPPHKREQPLTDAAIRLEMLLAATTEDPRFEIRDIELRRAGPSYTVDTLREMRRLEPAAELFLLIGTDQWLEFDTWHDPQGVRELARVIVLAREGAASAGNESGQPAAHVDAAADASRAHRAPDATVEVTRIDLSSTMIRDRVAAGEPIRYLVPDSVERVIAREGLYGKTAR